MRETPRTAPEEVFCALEVPLGLHSRFREGGESALDECEVILRRGVERACVVLRSARHGPFEIRLRLGIASVLREPHAHRKVRLRVAGVDLKRTLVVGLRVDEAVLELVEPEADLVCKFGGPVFFRRLRIRHLRRQLHVLWLDLGDRCVGEKHLAALICDRSGKLLVFRRRIDLYRLAPRRVRVDGDVLLFKDDGRGTRPCVPAVARDARPYRFAVARDARPYRHPHRAALQRPCRMETDKHFIGL